MRVSSVPSIGILLILSACGTVVEEHDRGEVCIGDGEVHPLSPVPLAMVTPHCSRH